MSDSELLATFYKLSLVEWTVLIACMLLAMLAHALKKYDEARTAQASFSVKEHFSKHFGAVGSSLIMQFIGLYYLVDSGTHSIFTVLLLGLSSESVGGWIRSKSTFK